MEESTQTKIDTINTLVLVIQLLKHSYKSEVEKQECDAMTKQLDALIRLYQGAGA
jgi:FtsZ-binding cell division protein ZapB